MSDEGPTESRRILEQHALRNARALVDRLETDEAARRGRQKRALWIIGGVALVPIVVMALWTRDNPQPTPAEKKQRACEVDAWSARAGEVTERIRAANPGMDYREIAQLLKREQDDIMLEAKAACRGEPAKAGR